MKTETRGQRSEVRGQLSVRSVVRHLSSVIWLLLLSSVVCRPSSVFALDPASVSIISLREEPVADVSQTEFYRGAPLLLTNCIAFAGTTTNSARQNLTNLFLIVSIGTITSNIAYTGTIAVATSGSWWARIDSVPTNWDTPKLQLKLTNSTDVFIYPFKNLKVKTPL